MLGLWHTSYTLHVLRQLHPHISINKVMSLAFYWLKLRDRYTVDRNGLDGVEYPPV